MTSRNYVRDHPWRHAGGWSVAGRLLPNDAFVLHDRSSVEIGLPNHPGPNGGTGSVPQDEGPDETDDAGEGEDPADHVEVDSRHMHVHGQSQDEAERDEEDADSYAYT